MADMTDLRHLFSTQSPTHSRFSPTTGTVGDPSHSLTPWRPLDGTRAALFLPELQHQLSEVSASPELSEVSASPDRDFTLAAQVKGEDLETPLSSLNSTGDGGMQSCHASSEAESSDWGYENTDRWGGRVRRLNKRNELAAGRDAAAGDVSDSDWGYETELERRRLHRQERDRERGRRIRASAERRLREAWAREANSNSDQELEDSDEDPEDSGSEYNDDQNAGCQRVAGRRRTCSTLR